MSISRKRHLENIQEEIRKVFLDDLWDDAQILNNNLLLRNVDEDAINKCRLSQYGQLEYSVARMTAKTGDDVDMQKARATKTTGAHDLDERDFALDQNIEKIYFDYYGHGYNDSPVIDRPGAPYTCVCGTKFMMAAKSMPRECPRCKRLTPIGELCRDGVMSR